MSSVISEAIGPKFIGYEKFFNKKLQVSRHVRPC